MQSGEWVIHEGRLALRAGDQSLIHPGAMEIFRHVFYGEPIVQGIKCSLVGSDLPALAFSRIPGEPTLRLLSGDGVVTGLFGIVVSSEFTEVRDDVDQILVDGMWVPIDEEALRSSREAATRLGVLGSSVRISSLVRLRLSRDLSFDVIDEAASVGQGLLAPSSTHGEVRGIEGELYPYQAQGVRFLRMIAEQRIGCILADEMGLGKTLQVISLIQSELNEGRGPTLVVAPATLLENWRRELEKFAPGLSVLLHSGSSRAGVVSKLVGPDVVVASYETVIRDEPLLSSVPWHIVVLDEAQAIKNPAAQRTGAVKRLPRNVGVAVSGTPLENRIDDLWSVADFCLPGLLGALEDFRSEFSDEIEDAVRLAPVVGPLILRRRVVDVAKDLPSKIEIPQIIRMSRKMAQAYEDIRSAILAEYGPAAGLVATTKLRSFSAHPSLIEGWSADPSDNMPKYQRLLEILEEVFALGEKVLVFSTFRGMADIFQDDLPKRFSAGFYRTIDGRVPVASRQEIVDDFFEHEGYGALFLNPKAAGTGLNITAANHVIHYNPEWNPALTAQATARAYRRKQLKPVTIHHLAFADSVEEVILSRASFKRELAGAAVTGHDGDVELSAIARALEISPMAAFKGE